MRIATLPATRLREAHREQLASHFLRLDAEDRRLRFGAPLGDDALRAYVARIDFVHDGAFAVQDEALEIVAAVHVAGYHDCAELGLSVLGPARGKGLGGALFRRAVTYLRNRGVREVFVHCLSENAAMMHLARANAMRLVADGSESDARLALAPPDAATYLAEWTEEQQSQALQSFRRGAMVARTLATAMVPRFE
jgi:RimJ/RimL family protein N-acetyltransferase